MEELKLLEIPDPDEALVYCADMAKNDPPPDKIGKLEERIGKIEGQLQELSRTVSGIVAQIRAAAWIGGALVLWLAWLSNMTYADRGTLGGLSARMDACEKRLDKIDQALEQIHKDLQPLVAKNVVLDASKSTPDQLKVLLPKVRSTLEVATKQGLKLDTAELDQIRAKLVSVDQSAPDFWQASSSLVDYLSRQSFTGAIPSSAAKFAPGPFTNPQLNHTNVLIDGEVFGGNISNAVVTFGPNAQLHNVHFLNCIFVFQYSHQPSEPQKRIGGQLLLASRLTDLSVSEGRL